MPMPAYLTIEGTHQGLISAKASTKESIGNSYQSEHADQILVQGFNHHIYVPNSAARGNYRQYDSIIVTKAVDRTSPLIHTAVASAEALVRCQFDFYRIVGEGAQVHYFSIELRDALLVSMKMCLPDCLNPDNATQPFREEIRISFREILLTHETSCTVGEDQWK